MTEPEVVRVIILGGINIVLVFVEMTPLLPDNIHHGVTIEIRIKARAISFNPLRIFLFQIININEKLPTGSHVDLIAQKNDMVYLIEVKNRNVSHFDIINQSTISTYLKSETIYENTNINNILITKSSKLLLASKLNHSTSYVLFYLSHSTLFTDRIDQGF